MWREGAGLREQREVHLLWVVFGCWRHCFGGPDFPLFHHFFGYGHPRHVHDVPLTHSPPDRCRTNELTMKKLDHEERQAEIPTQPK